MPKTQKKKKTKEDRKIQNVSLGKEKDPDAMTPQNVKFEKSKLWRPRNTTVVTNADGKKTSRLQELLYLAKTTLDDPFEMEKRIIIGKKADNVYAWAIATSIMKAGTAHAIVGQARELDRAVDIQKKVLGILTYARTRIDSFADVQVRTALMTVHRSYKGGVAVEHHLVFTAEPLNLLNDDTGKTQE